MNFEMPSQAEIMERRIDQIIDSILWSDKERRKWYSWHDSDAEATAAIRKIAIERIQKEDAR